MARRANKSVSPKVYPMVFVLSYSRLIYVAASTLPIDTGTLTRMHDSEAGERSGARSVLWRQTSCFMECRPIALPSVPLMRAVNPYSRMGISSWTKSRPCSAAHGLYRRPTPTR